MAENNQSEVEQLHQQLALERKKLEDERKKLELERKNQEDNFLKLKQEFHRKKEVEDREKKKVEGLRRKLESEQRRLEDERKRLLLDKEKQDYEYQNIQEQFNRQTHLGQEQHVPDPKVHSTQETNVVKKRVVQEKHAASQESMVVSSTKRISTSPSTRAKNAKPSSSKGDLICVVCGDKASGLHFKALTCEGCKVFFRRNSKKQDSLKCHSDSGLKGQCEMDLYMRRHCAYCRMKKCLDVGMEINRVWDKERCKTRKQIKKNVLTPATVSFSEDTNGISSGASSSSSPTRPELTEEQQQLMALVYEAFISAIKLKGSKGFRTSEKLSDIKKKSRMQESEIALAIFGNMGSLLNNSSTSVSEVSYIPSYFTEDLFQLDGMDLNFDVEAKAQDTSETDEVEEKFPFNEALFNYVMEITVIALKELIAFVKALPGFTDLSTEDQAALVKETFVEFIVIKSAGYYDHEREAFCNAAEPEESFQVRDFKKAGFTQSVQHLIPFAERMGKLKLSREEHATLLAICLLTPDRHVLSEEAKTSIGPHHEKLLEALCTSGQVNHPDQPHFIAKIVGVLTQVRDCTESFMGNMRKLKLEGQYFQPILGEMFEM